jgi:DNA-binding PadR family transcriptional regulator
MTNAELAILSLVAEQPRHGYEIETVIEQRGMREWTEIGFSSIYYLLKKLERGGLVVGQPGGQSGKGPPRVVYSITQKGSETLYTSLLEALSIPHPCYSPFQLGLSCLPVIHKGEAVDALRQHQTSLTERAEHILRKWEEQKPLPYYVDAMFDHSLSVINAQLEWLEKFIRQMEANHVEN